jgi:hypothetical protein
LRKGLSLLPEPLFEQYYVAKQASWDCILSCIATNLCEMDALDKIKNVLLEAQKLDEGQLAYVTSELEIFKEVAGTRSCEIKQQLVHHNNVHAEETRALAICDTQLGQMANLSDPEVSSSKSDSDYDSVYGDEGTSSNHDDAD